MEKILNGFMERNEVEIVTTLEAIDESCKLKIQLAMANEKQFIIAQAFNENGELVSFEMLKPVIFGAQNPYDIILKAENYIHDIIESNDDGDDFDEIIECRLERHDVNDFLQYMKLKKIETSFVDSINDCGIVYDIYKCYPVNREEADYVKSKCNYTYKID